MKHNTSLSKVLNLWDSMAISIGVAIGVGIFRVPSEVARFMPIPQFILLAWIIGGLFSIIGALCYAELSSSFPRTGGDYIYLRESYGPLMAFLYGWSSILVIRTGIIAAVAFVFAEYTSSLFCLGNIFVKPIAIFIVLFLSIINAFKLHLGKNILNIAVLAKIIALIGIIIFAFGSKKGNIGNLYVEYHVKSFKVIYMLGLALVPILWTYGGWHENTFMTGETKDPEKILPIALIVGTLSITVIYVFINGAYLFILSVKNVANASLIAGKMMKIIFGNWAKKITDALIVISSFGTLNATIMTSSRITYAMSDDNSLFKYLSYVDKRFHTPLRAIMVNAFWSIILVIWGNFGKLLFFTGILIWLFFGAIVFGVILLRRKYPDINRPFMVWGYPIVPLIFVVVCLYICIDIFFKYPVQSFTGIFIMLSGIPAYFLISKIQKLFFLYK